MARSTGLFDFCAGEIFSKLFHTIFLMYWCSRDENVFRIYLIYNSNSILFAGFFEEGKHPTIPMMYILYKFHCHGAKRRVSFLDFFLLGLFLAQK